MFTMRLESSTLIVDIVGAQSSSPFPGQCTLSLAVSVGYSWLTVALFPRKLTSANKSHPTPKKDHNK